MRDVQKAIREGEAPAEPGPADRSAPAGGIIPGLRRTPS
jgi:hypothetical protein